MSARVPTARGLTRRRFIGAATGTAALGALPPSLQRALVNGPDPAHGSLDEIEHVIMLMQENRSFDQYFGSLSGVRGFDDPHAARLPSGRSVFYQRTR